jgi:membrane-bound lytic murein transglycosylase D
MRVDAVVDERLDPYRSTESAARLLSANYRITGSWPTAITAYNHGAGGMRRAIEQLGTDDIETIVRRYRGRAFGFASRNFYVSFLAAADVRANAERYFGKLEREAPDPSVMVRLPDNAPAEALERVLGVDRVTLARYNPSLRDPVWAGRRQVPRGHRLYLPPRPGLDPATLLAAVPPGAWSGAVGSDRYHVVRAGESLSSIAPRYGLRVVELAASNGLRDPDHVRVGQQLLVPAVAANRAAAAARAPAVAVRMVDADGRAVAPVAPAPAASGSTTVAGGPITQPRPADGGPTAAAGAAGANAASSLAGDLSVTFAVGPDGRIRVVEGETLGLYADWLGIGEDALRRHNGIAGGDGIQVGGTLSVPLTKVDRATFEQRRIAHHQTVRGAFLAQHRIEGVQEHLVRPGESVWFLAERRYRIPVWLLREYNPGLDLAAVQPGTRIVIPRVTR